jgi:molybdopterin-guanine dinucleotide biosynthesis protein A
MLAAEGRFREILVVARAGRTGGRDGEDARGIRTVADQVAGAGPLGGIHAALTAARDADDRAVFVLACDMPYVSEAFVAYLLGLSDESDAVVPRTEGGYHPLCAVYGRACLEPIARRLSERRLKVIDVLDDVKAHVVDPEEIDRFGDPHRLLANVNTPAEYEYLRHHALPTAHNHQP